MTVVLWGFTLESSCSHMHFEKKSTMVITTMIRMTMMMNRMLLTTAPTEKDFIVASSGPSAVTGGTVITSVTIALGTPIGRVVVDLHSECSLLSLPAQPE